MKKKPRRLKAQHKWWAVAAVYKVIQPNTSSRYRRKRWGERRIILVDAEDRASAERLGLALAKEGEAQYRGGLGDLVCWKFQKLEYTVELLGKGIGHGTEVYNDWLVDDKRRDRKPVTV